MKLLNVSAISPKIKLGDILYNEGEILNEINKNMKNNEDVLLFPEYSLSGKLQSLQNTDLILKQSLSSLKRIMDKTKFSNTIIVIGIPFKEDSKVYSTAFVFQNGDLLGIVPKNYTKEVRFINIPHNIGEDIPFGNLLFSSEEYSFSVEFGEDLYKALSPSDFYGALGADFILNLSTLSYLPNKDDELKSLIKSKVLRSNSSYIYAESSIFESTTDTVNKGRLIIKTEDRLIENKGFSLQSDCVNSFIDIRKIRNLKANQSTDLKIKYDNDVFPVYKLNFKHYLNEITDFSKVKIKKNPFLKSSEKENNKLFSEILDIQSYALARRLLAIGINKAVIGISGGLDSTLALIVIVKAFKILDISNKNIITITMPGFGTTGKTLLNSKKLCNALGTDLREIDIKEAALLHFKDISHDKNIHDNTYENVQARERTQILMDIANKENAIVVGTGDLSELALGWATFNGDHMSMYGVNSSIPKTLVKELIKFYASSEENKDLRETLLSILNTPISPELLPKDNKGNIAQITEDIIGPYELHDFFIYYMIKYKFSFNDIFERAIIAFKDDYDEETIKKWLNLFIKRFISQQFKRSSMPDGPQATEISLSPREGYKIPSDMSFNSFLIK